MILHAIFACDASYCFSKNNVSYRMSKRGEKRREEKLGNQTKFVKKKKQSFMYCQ